MESRGPQPLRSHVRRFRRDEVHAQDDDQGGKLPTGQPIHKPLAAEGFGLWAVEEKASGAFIGRIGLMVHDDWPEGEHKTEVGWMLDRPYWGRGLATEGALASVGYGFEELGLERIISITLRRTPLRVG